MRSCLGNLLLLGITCSIFIGTCNNFSELSYNDSSASFLHEQSYSFTKKPSKNKDSSLQKQEVVVFDQNFFISDFSEITTSSIDGKYKKIELEIKRVRDLSLVEKILIPITSNGSPDKKAEIQYDKRNSKLVNLMKLLIVEMHEGKVQYFYLRSIESSKK